MYNFQINKKKKITVATTISASGSVKAGGANVVHGLYTCLAKYFDIEVVYIAPAGEKYRKYEIIPGLTEIVVPKTKEHIIKEKEITDRLKAATTYDISLMYCLDETPIYGDILKKSISTSDIVFIERPYLVREVKKYLNGRTLFQRSQNIEYYFRKSNIPDSYEASKVLNDLFELEKECCEICDINYACSLEDLRTMNQLYNISKEKLKLLSNGVFCSDNPFVSVERRKKLKKLYALDNEKIAIFIGGGHRPNIEACEMILKIAIYCKETKFFFAGSLCNSLLKKELPSNVGLLGLISEETRRHLFSVSDIALNPMYSGSGSNIKMFDYMSMGIPIITTRFGARGICDISSFHIADTEKQLIESIQTFNLDIENENTLKARMLIELKYDWNVITEDVKNFIMQFI